jgi:hypothetical protein
MQHAQHVADQFILKLCLCEQAKQTAPAVSTVAKCRVNTLVLRVTSLTLYRFYLFER